MAKKLNVGQTTTLPYSSVHWFHADNTRISVGDPLADLETKIDPDGQPSKGEKHHAEGLVVPMLGGWDSGKNVKVLRVEDYQRLHSDKYPDVESVLSAVQKERQDQITAWEMTERTKGLANIAKRVWFPNGKPAEIVAIGNEAYRRSIGVMGALYRRTLPPLNDDSLTYDINIVVVNFGSAADALVSHVLENTGKDIGRRNYQPLDYLKIALLRWEADRAHFQESDLTKMGISRGTAQKVYAVARLAVKHPELRIAERCFLPAPPTGEMVEYRAPGTNGPDDVGSYLPMDRFEKEVTRRVADGYDVDDSTRSGGELPAAEQSKVAEKLLTRVSGGKTLAIKAISTTEIGAWKDSPCLVLRYIGKAIGAGNSQAIKTLEGEAVCKLLNEAYFAAFPQERPATPPAAPPAEAKVA